jgi:uncharacterized membrane protein YcjF (UPF0283 family)
LRVMPSQEGARAARPDVWSREKWVTVTIAASLAALAVVYLAIVVVPEWRADRVNLPRPEAQGTPQRQAQAKARADEAQAKARGDERTSVRTAMLALLAGGIAAFGAVYTARTAR